MPGPAFTMPLPRRAQWKLSMQGEGDMRPWAPQDDSGSQRAKRVGLALGITLLLLLLFGGGYVLGHQSSDTGQNATAGVGAQNSGNVAATGTTLPTTTATTTTKTGTGNTGSS